MNKDVLTLNLPAHFLPKPKQGKQSRVEVFSADSDLSAAERFVIADQLRRLSESITDEDKKKRLVKEANRYQVCGHAGVLFTCPNDNLRYFVKAHCRSRICEPCARRYVKRLAPQLKDILVGIRRRSPANFILSQVTLTITSKRFGDELPDRAGIRRLYRESRDLLNLYFGRYVCRRSSSGKVVEKRRPKRGRKPGEDGRVWLGAGWAAVIEVGRDNNNLHIHALTWGPYRSVWLLRHEWSKITGDSYGVDIRKKALDESVKYVVKYIAKPPATDSYGRLAEYANMIKGSRRLRCGGVFYGQVKTVKVSGGVLSCFMCQARLFFSETIEDIDSASALDYYKLHHELEKGDPGGSLAKIEQAVAGISAPDNMPF